MGLGGHGRWLAFPFSLDTLALTESLLSSAYSLIQLAS